MASRHAPAVHARLWREVPRPTAANAYKACFVEQLPFDERVLGPEHVGTLTT